MTRFRMTVSTEWDAHPDEYETEDVAEMLAIDQANAEDDPFGFLNIGDVGLTVKVEDVTPRTGPRGYYVSPNDFRVDL